MFSELINILKHVLHFSYQQNSNSTTYKPNITQQIIKHTYFKNNAYVILEVPPEAYLLDERDPIRASNFLNCLTINKEDLRILFWANLAHLNIYQNNEGTLSTLEYEILYPKIFLETRNFSSPFKNVVEIFKVKLLLSALHTDKDFYNEIRRPNTDAARVIIFNNYLQRHNQPVFNQQQSGINLIRLLESYRRQNVKLIIPDDAQIAILRDKAQNINKRSSYRFTFFFRYIIEKKLSLENIESRTLDGVYKDFITEKYNLLAIEKEQPYFCRHTFYVDRFRYHLGIPEPQLPVAPINNNIPNINVNTNNTILDSSTMNCFEKANLLNSCGIANKNMPHCLKFRNNSSSK